MREKTIEFFIFQGKVTNSSVFPGIVESPVEKVCITRASLRLEKLNIPSGTTSIFNHICFFL